MKNYYYACYKKGFVAAILVMLMMNVSAQNFFLGAFSGYGTKLGSQNLEYFNLYDYSTDGSSSSYTQKNVSLGKGFSAGGEIGYMFNENLGVVLGSSYLWGGHSKASRFYSNSQKVEYSLFAKMVRITPSLIIAAGKEKINPYAKFGLVLGSGKVYYEKNEIWNGNVIFIKYIFNKDFAFGFSSALGSSFKLSRNFSLIGEVSMINLSYAPAKGEMVVATSNGVDGLDDLSVSDKEIEYVDQYDISGTQSESEPSKDLKQKLPFGSIGLNLGLRFNIQ